MTRHRVAFVTTSLERGGAETQVFLLARGLAARGHPVHVVSMRDPDAYEEELAELGIPFTSLRMRSGVPDPRAILRLARVIRDWRPDIVHGHMVHANLLTRITRLVAPMPVLISTAHNLVEGSRWRELAYRWTDRLATLTTNVAPSAVARYVQAGCAPEHKIRFVPNGLDVAPYANDPSARRRLRERFDLDHAFIWLAIGRLELQKDYPNMLRALERLRRSTDRAVSTLVVGEGSLAAELRSLAATHGLGEHDVRFLGTRTDVPDLMQAADAFVMSSAWEGLPMVLLEAGASRLPVVATDVGGNRDIVEPGRTGILVPPGDATALADAMSAVMDLDPDERARWGTRAHDLVIDRYLIDHVLDVWESLYTELIEHRRVRRGGDDGPPAIPTAGHDR